VQSGLDVRLLSEIIRRWVLLLKSDSTLDTFFVSEYDPSAVEKDVFVRTKLTDAQKEALLVEKGRVFKEELVPQVYNDILEARGSQEIDLFLDAYLFMVEHGKTQYLKQFEEQFARLTSEGFGEIPVTVTTAFELSEEQKALVQAQLDKKAVDGATPVPVYKVNATIMGGVHINWNMQHEFSSTTRSWFEDGLENLKKGINEEAH
jgi:F0F1-type ATP synthase delta subunit